MWAQLKATLLAGHRSRSFRILLIFAVGMVGASVLAGTFSGRQPQTVMLDVSISSIRMIGLMMVLFWCQDLISREIDRRTVLFMLAYSRPRYSYLLGRYFGILLLALGSLVVLSGLAVLMAGTELLGYKQALPPDITKLPVVVMMLWLELAVVAAFTIAMTAFSTTPYLPLVLGGAFAVSARLLGPVMAYLATQTADASIKANFAKLVDLIHWLLPDLSRLDIRGVALYHLPIPVAQIVNVSLQALVFSALLLWLAVQVFNRRQFES